MSWAQIGGMPIEVSHMGPYSVRLERPCRPYFSSCSGYLGGCAALPGPTFPEALDVWSCYWSGWQEWDHKEGGR